VNGRASQRLGNIVTDSISVRFIKRKIISIKIVFDQLIDTNADTGQQAK
jgi:hypothetical protein